MSVCKRVLVLVLVLDWIQCLALVLQTGVA